MFSKLSSSFNHFSANNFAMNSRRKTISPQDVLEAMKEMEFERFNEKLKVCLEGDLPSSLLQSLVKT